MNARALKHIVLACFALSFLLTLSCSGGGGGSSSVVFPVVTATYSGSVSGIVRYQDKEYDRNGFTGTNPFRTVRFASVEVVDSSSSKSLASGITGADGSYSLSYSGAGAQIFVRVLAQAELGGAPIIRVRNAGNAIYAAGSGSFASSGVSAHNIDIDLTSFSQVAGAYNILDVLTTGMQFAHELTGSYPPSLSAFWDFSGTDGTYYCSSGCTPGAGMFIIGNLSGDTDGFDDDVILHEFGHFLADTYSRDDSPGGVHYIGELTEDMRLSWSEGWGDFSPLAVRHWQAANDPSRISSTDTAASLYVDTNDSQVPPINFYIVFGNPLDNDITGWQCSTHNECFSYSSNEIAIANVLWNSMTGAGNFGMQPIWSAIGSWHGASTSTVPLVNLETFWDTWILQRSPGGDEYAAGYAAELSSLRNVYDPVNIFYAKDAYEPDGASNSATPIGTGATNHTLYAGAGQLDSDYFAFHNGAANNISIATSGLANGADTSIAVLGESAGNFVPLTINDNASGLTYVLCSTNTGANCYGYYYQDSLGNWANKHPLNDANTLSSQAAFNSTGASNYIIVVNPSPNRPDSAGRYGSYTLTITSQ